MSSTHFRRYSQKLPQKRILTFILKNLVALYKVIKFSAVKISMFTNFLYFRSKQISEIRFKKVRKFRRKNNTKLAEDTHFFSPQKSTNFIEKRKTFFNFLLSKQMLVSLMRLRL